MSTNDFKTFESINNKVNIPEGHKHGTIFMVKKKTVKKLLKFSNQGQ